jgi:hypothetical protein
VSALAEWPKRVENLFSTKEKSEDGKYVVYLYDMGIKKEITLDDFFPYNEETKDWMFSRTN